MHTYVSWNNRFEIRHFAFLPINFVLWNYTSMKCNQETTINNKILQESIELKQNLAAEKKFDFWAILILRY